MPDNIPENPTIVVIHHPDEGRPPGLEPLENEARLIFISYEPALADAIEQADVVLVTNFYSSMLENVWHKAKRLKWVHAASAGVNNLMFDGLVNSDIPLTNARGIFNRSISEFVLGLIVIFAKDFLGTLAAQREHRWNHRDTEFIENKNALVVGAGAIGRQIGRLLSAAGLNAYGVDISARRDDPDFEEVYATDDLESVLPLADYVVIAAPLTPETQGLFDAAKFKAMKNSAIFINIARGPIVKTDALIKALQAGEIAGAGLDVFEEEPLPPDHPLWDMPNVVISPHMSGDFIGWREALNVQFIENYRRWKTGKKLFNIVNKSRGYVAGKE